MRHPIWSQLNPEHTLLEEFRHRNGIAKVELPRGAEHQKAPVVYGLSLAVLMPEQQTTFVIKTQEEFGIG
ncbi:MAG: hypothetical protein ACK6BM_08340, partial [Cyanobacteriota bacterium]